MRVNRTSPRIRAREVNKNPNNPLRTAKQQLDQE